MTRGYRERLADIHQAIDRIRRAESLLVAAEVSGDEAAADVSFDAILYNLVVIGEAVGTLPEATRARAPEVPWRDITDMRNFLAHEYFRVRAALVRSTIDAPLDALASAVTRLAEAD